MARSNAKQCGFTLIELLIVLSITGVLTIIGMPALGSMIARAHQQSAESALQASLMHAREIAVERGVQVIVCPSADARQCDASTSWQRGWLIGVDTDHDRQPDPDTAPLAVFNSLPIGMQILASNGRPRIVFRTDGSASGTNAQLTVCHRGAMHNGLAVIVANSGRVRVAPAQPDRLQACLAASK